MTTRVWSIAAGVVIASTLGAAQTPESERFEVASIKRNHSLDRAIGGGARGDTYRVTNITVRTLLEHCYGSRFIWSEIVGGPAWVELDTFDIVAKTSAGRSTMAMVLALLADRFKLRTHEELRERDVYRLVIDRADRQLGPNVTPSRADDDRSRCTTRIQPGLFAGKCVTLGWLLDSQLQWAAQRRIIDDTGLTGQFDIDLRWDPALESSPDQRVPSDAPSIFTAVREQLGLRLESGKARVPVLVIDSIEPPTED